jgi:WD domain, G-beta repeat
VQVRSRHLIGPPALLALSLALTGACSKEKSSLVEFDLTADARATDQRSLTLIAGSVTQTFELPAGLSATSTFFGVYTPGNLTGLVALNAESRPLGGCVGYHGSGSVMIAAEGVTVSAPIMMRATNLCLDGGVDAASDGPTGGSDGGSGGQGGGGGKGGSGGGGGSTGAGGSGQGGSGQGGSGQGGSGQGGSGQGGSGQGGSGQGGSGQGGSGQGGSGQGGASGAGGSAPSLVACTEINHANTMACGPTCTAAGDSIVYGVAFEPNGQIMVTGGTDGRVKVWRVSGQTFTPEGHVFMGTGFGMVAFSPDGSLLAIGRVGGIDILDTSTWSVLRTLTVGSTVYGVAFSPDQTKVISLDKDTSRTGPDSRLYVHSVGAITALSTVNLSLGFSLAVAPAQIGSSTPVAVTTDNGSLLLYSLTNATLSGPTTLPVTSDGSVAETAMFSRQGTVLAAGGDDGVVHLWSTPFLSTSSPLDMDFIGGSSGYSEWVTALAFTPSGGYLAVGGGFFGAVEAWSTANPPAQIGTPYESSNYDIASLTFSPDGRLLVGGEFGCGCVVVCPQ